jgi:hypothetical protein
MNQGPSGRPGQSLVGSPAGSTDEDQAGRPPADVSPDAEQASNRAAAADENSNDAFSREAPTGTAARSSIVQSLASSQAAVTALLLYCLVAFFLVLLKFANSRWFNRDEWYFLSGRDANTLDGLFAPHNEHWTTLPVVVFKAIYAVVGVHSYRPYQAVVLIAHITVCVLLWIIMRRVGVRPWIATCAAAVLVLFGPGNQNIAWAFQITFTGSIVFGLAHLILVDHDGPIDRRDWIGLGLGAAGLMTSGVAPVMVVAVGSAALLRRGWKLAMFHTAPLAAMYFVWYLIEDPSSENIFGPPPVSAIADWVKVGEWSIFQAVGQVAAVGVLLAVMLLVGLLVAWLPLDWATFRVRAAMPLGLLLCVPLFYAASSTNRWVLGSDLARASRYLYIGAALTLPALGVAADAIARRWRLLTPAVVVLLLFGIPWNVGKFEDRAYPDFFFRRQEQIILGAAYSARAESLPDWVEPEPDPRDGQHLTMGWLRAAKRAGKLPPPVPMDASIERQLEIQLGLVATREPVSPELNCRKETKVALRPRRGDRIGIMSEVNVRQTADGESRASPAVRYAPIPKLVPGSAEGVELEVMFDDLYLLFESPQSGSFTICT